MKRLGFVFLLALIAGAGYYLYRSYHQNDYVAAIETHRNRKDIWLANDETSPFVITNTPFKRLRYYPVDPAYRIRAQFEPPAKHDSLTLTTSTGEPQTYLIAGTASFRLQGQDCSLLVFYVGPGENLFIPFMDATRPRQNVLPVAIEAGEKNYH